MTVRHILGFVWRDLVNRRVAVDAVAGMTTLAFATAVSALSIAFFTSAERMSDAALEPMQSSAGVLHITAKAGSFTASEYNELEKSIRELGARIAAMSPIVIEIEDDIFTLLNQDLSETGMYGNVIWSVPYDAPLLSKEYGATYLWGDSFVPAPGIERGRLSCLPKEEGAEVHPCLGVILNRRFVCKYLPELPDSCSGVATADFKEIEEIPIEFLVPASENNDDRTFTINLRVTGMVDEPTWADLIFTEDLARAYFFANGFPGWYAGEFYQWEREELLTDRQFEQKGYFPDEFREFDYSSLSRERIRRSPYGLLVVAVRDWQTEGKRQEIVKLLDEPIKLENNVAAGAEAKNLAKWALEVASERATMTGGDYSDIRKKFADTLRDETELKHLTEEFTVRAVKGEEPHGNVAKRFKVEDLQSKVFLTAYYNPDVEQIKFELKPPWKTYLPDRKAANALIGLDTVVDTYETVMFLMVLVLAASAALLLALSHLERKRRDIGLLLVHGAGRSDIFAIYIGQMAFMSVFGWILGVALSFLAAPVLESAAARTLTLSLKIATEAQMSETSALILSHTIFAEAFAWVVPAALAGAVYPVYIATRLDPLSSLDRGG